MKLSRGLIAFCAMLSIGVCSAAPIDKPNVVLIFIDDMGYGDIGPFGNTINQTPQLDRMAAEGNVLRQFYVSNTACTPEVFRFSNAVRRSTSQGAGPALALIVMSPLTLSAPNVPLSASTIDVRVDSSCTTPE